MQSFFTIILVGTLFIGALAYFLNTNKGTHVIRDISSGVGASQAEAGARNIGKKNRLLDDQRKAESDLLQEKMARQREATQHSQDQLRSSQERTQAQKDRLEAQMQRMRGY